MYSGKSIALIGGETLIGRILLTKLVGVLNSPCRVLMLQPVRSAKSKVSVEVKPITRDAYFKLSVEKSQAQNSSRVEITYVEYSVGEVELEIKG